MRQWMLTLWASAAIVLMLCGCANDAQRFMSADATYKANLQALIDLRPTGAIDDATALRIEVYRKAARAALDEWETDLLEGRESGAAAAFSRALRMIVAARLEARKAGGT